MKLSLYNGAYVAEGEPTDMALFLAFHIDAMHKIVEKNQQDQAEKAVAELMRKMFSQPDENRNQEDK